MKKVVLYEPSIGSNNLGDQIIVDSVKSVLRNYFEDAFIIEFPTHTPLSNRYLHYIGEADMKIVCGSNIIVGKLNTILHLRQWAVGSSIASIGPLVFMGVGSQQYGQTISKYSKWAYQRMMRSDFIHSVRDRYTENALKKIGIRNVINTACPTMWGFTKDSCEKIPKGKSGECCVFTLTDYKPNINRDNKMIEVLLSNYKNTFFWPQGIGDWKYFRRLKYFKDITVIAPNLSAYDYFLSDNDTDYIGTRLHGGIRAIQKGKRTLIIGIDNRALELNKDFGIPVLNEKYIDFLEEKVNSEYKTDIMLPENNIKKFLSQF